QQIAGANLRAPHAGAVDDRAVGRSQVLNDPFVVPEDEPGVPSRHAGVTKDDVAALVPADQQLGLRAAPVESEQRGTRDLARGGGWPRSSTALRREKAGGAHRGVLRVRPAVAFRDLVDVRGDDSV